MHNKPCFRLWSAMALLVLLLSSCAIAGEEASHSAGGDFAAPGSVAAPAWGQPTKNTRCQRQASLQDKDCTPGAIFPDVTKEQICVSGYAGSVRNVSTSLKRKVYEMYGVTTRHPGQYEVDHLVNLSIGGSNDIANLWPQPAEPKPGYREKNLVENWLHDQVCSGAMELKDAQIAIAVDWVAVYNRMPKNYQSQDNDDNP